MRSKQAAIQNTSTRFYAIWDTVARFAREIRDSDFIQEMVPRRDAYGSEGVMGSLDCAALYGWNDSSPAICENRVLIRSIDLHRGRSH